MMHKINALITSENSEHRQVRLSAFAQIKDRGSNRTPSPESGYAVLGVVERPAPTLGEDGSVDWVPDEIVVWFVQPRTDYVGLGKYFPATAEGELDAITHYDHVVAND